MRGSNPPHREPFKLQLASFNRTENMMNWETMSVDEKLAVCKKFVEALRASRPRVSTMLDESQQKCCQWQNVMKALSGDYGVFLRYPSMTSDIYQFLQRENPDLLRQLEDDGILWPPMEPRKS